MYEDRYIKHILACYKFHTDTYAQKFLTDDWLYDKWKKLKMNSEWTVTEQLQKQKITFLYH